MSRTLRWGILSTASIALSAFIPGIQGSKHGEIAAIASRSAKKAAEVAEKYSIPKAYGSYEELLADSEIDAVYIPLPNHLHKEWTMKAARSGKHVLCEKPAALNADDTAEMVEVCRQAGVIFAEAFMYRYHPKHKRVKEILSSGEIGQIRGIHGKFTFNHIIDKNNVRYQKDMGGGSLYDVGCYPLSAARMYLEKEPIAATVQAFYSPEHDVDMIASGIVEFPDSIALTFDCAIWAAPRCSMEILGTDGWIELPYAFGWERSENEVPVIVHTREGSRGERMDVANSFSLQADAFADAVLHGTRLPFAPEDAILNMKVLDACRQSARTSSRIQI